LLFSKNENNVIINKNGIVTNYRIDNIVNVANSKTVTINVTDFDKPNKYQFTLTKDKPEGMVISLRTPKGVYLTTKPKILTKSIVVQSMDQSVSKTAIKPYVSKKPVTKSWSTPDNCDCAEYKEYTIVSGDTYYSLAKRFKTTVERIKNANCELKIGERLCRTKKNTVTSQPKAENW
jgi:hypothetical protein